MTEPLPVSSLHVRPGVESVPAGPSKPVARRRAVSVEELAAGVLKADRARLGQALSLVESGNPAHRGRCIQLLERLAPFTGKALRVGITGTPGVGKSTFIETLGMRLVNEGHRVAVLAVDPSSVVSGGAILGDKTRMENLARHSSALIRPSSGGGFPGGVARGTREAILVVEAAGFDVVFVETIGVGQSEVQVASMVDFFLMLTLAGAGDELQGIKRGIMEMVDGVAVNKADGDNLMHARVARAEMASALHLLHPATEGWQPRVLTCSSITGDGIADVWKMIEDHRAHLEATGLLGVRRLRQAREGLRNAVERLLLDRLRRDERFAAQWKRVESAVESGAMTPVVAAETFVDSILERMNTESNSDLPERSPQ